MSKIVQQSHTTSRKGVDAFATYCSSHVPQILWREETVNDFGVDGEVEPTFKNEEGKVEASGQKIKIQIKSTSTFNSYIKNETESSFTFYASASDMDYWSRHLLDVVLVIYDDRTGKIFAQKLPKLNVKGKSGRQSIPIIFDKIENEIVAGDNLFMEKFKQYSKDRLFYDNPESLSSNIFKLISIPKYLYSYETNITKSKEIYEQLNRTDYPIFVLYGKKIYTFANIADYPEFGNFLIKTKKELINLRTLEDNIPARNHFVELLKKYLGEFLYQNQIYYNKDYKRYYFGKPEFSDIRKEKYITRKTQKSGERTVVKYYEYGKYKFYKHFAFEFDFVFKDGFNLIMNPKYLFTSNGKDPIEPKLITKFTNGLTKQEYNSHVLDFVHFYFGILGKGYEEIRIVNRDGISFVISNYLKFNGTFQIPNDNKIINGDKKHPAVIQTELF
jgi:hypothetical protein